MPEGGCVGWKVRDRKLLISRHHELLSTYNGQYALMAEVIEGHIRFHVLDPKTIPTDEQTQAADDLIHALRAYLK